MKWQDFYDNVMADEELRLGGTFREGDMIHTTEDLDGPFITAEYDGLFVSHDKTKALWLVGTQAVLDTEWKVFRSIFVGKRDAVVLDHMTRIVGYYAFERNFNKSKIGENNARRKGNYTIPVAGSRWPERKSGPLM